MSTEFFDFSTEALTGIANGEMTPALALADYLSERGDGRGDRLRKRVKAVSKILYASAELLRRVSSGPMRERVLSRIDEISFDLADYLLRLTSVEPDKRLPRKAIAKSYSVIEPRG
jgi:hypothetical protein